MTDGITKHGFEEGLIDPDDKKFVVEIYSAVGDAEAEEVLQKVIQEDPCE